MQDILEAKEYVIRNLKDKSKKRKYTEEEGEDPVEEGEEALTKEEKKERKKKKTLRKQKKVQMGSLSVVLFYI